ncbi:MAG: 2-methylisocitrate lyase-like PEP mutase family enzyme [Acidimicrobiales bacterium]|jgi:2-methylisocitrate lyase-like PEP mutase family enzyme
MTMTMTMTDRFRQLHTEGTFVLPNPWDVGSARILESLGFEALATTSAGHAASKGRYDQNITLAEVLAHAEELVAVLGVPLNLDSERCFGETTSEVTANVVRLGDTGAAGFSIEDYNPATKAIDPIELATDRVAAAAEGAKTSGLVLTARTENHLYGVTDLDDTIARLRAFVAAGAECVYAPGLTELQQIQRVVSEVGAPLNVLTMPTCPTVPELASVGVRRVSTGSAIARSVHGALAAAGRELLETGTYGFTDDFLSGSDVVAAFGEPN